MIPSMQLDNEKQTLFCIHNKGIFVFSILTSEYVSGSGIVFSHAAGQGLSQSSPQTMSGVSEKKNSYSYKSLEFFPIGLI